MLGLVGSAVRVRLPGGGTAQPSFHSRENPVPSALCFRTVEGNMQSLMLLVSALVCRSCGGHEVSVCIELCECVSQRAGLPTAHCWVVRPRCWTLFGGQTRVLCASQQADQVVVCFPAGRPGCCVLSSGQTPLLYAAWRAGLVAARWLVGRLGYCVMLGGQPRLLWVAWRADRCHAVELAISAGGPCQQEGLGQRRVPDCGMPSVWQMCPAVAACWCLAVAACWLSGRFGAAVSCVAACRPCPAGSLVPGACPQVPWCF